MVNTPSCDLGDSGSIPDYPIMVLWAKGKSLGCNPRDLGSNPGSTLLKEIIKKKK